MMETPDMLKELFEAVQDEEIFNDDCEHILVSDTPQAFCCVCFVVNLYNNVSLQEPEFTEETSELQRQTIENLWEQWLNQ